MKWNEDKWSSSGVQVVSCSILVVCVCVCVWIGLRMEIPAPVGSLAKAQEPKAI